MSIKLKINLIILFFFLIFAIWKIFSTINEGEELQSKLNKEYKQIFLSDSINNKIINSYYPEKWRGYHYFQYITLDNGKKFDFTIDDCITSDKIYFGDIAKPGVKLLKNKWSDSLSVFLPNGDKYIFILKVKKQD